LGYDYVDDHSRLAYAEILPDEKGTTCAGFLLRAAAWFADHGIAHVTRVLTDNAKNYLISREFAAAITAVGARHKTIKPHCPWQNGKVERFNRTLQTECTRVFGSRDGVPGWVDGAGLHGCGEVGWLRG
jgi:transposase InsO family protein